MKRLDIRILLEVDDTEYVNSARQINDIFESIKVGLEKGCEIYTRIPDGGMNVVVVDE